MYEQGVTYIYMCEYGKAYETFNYLRKHNDWSKIFYNYATAITAWQIGKKEEALEILRETQDMDIKKIGGKKIAVEKFTMQRIERYLDRNNDETLHAWFDVACLEVTYAWNG